VQVANDVARLRLALHTPRASRNLSAGVMASAGYRLYGDLDTDLRVSIDGFDPALTSRDASRLTPSAFLSYRWPSSRTRTTASLSFVGNDADGSDFEYDALGYGVAVEQPFDTRFGQLRTMLGAYLVDRDYDEFSTNPQRQQDIIEIKASACSGCAFQTIDAIDQGAERSAERLYENVRRESGMP